MISIGVVGFYDRDNLGDETYKLAIPMLLGSYYKYTFICSDDIDTDKSQDDLRQCDILFIGPGDVINSYFFEKISPVLKTFKGPKIAFGVGIPFPSLIDRDHFDVFDHMFVRN